MWADGGSFGGGGVGGGGFLETSFQSPSAEGEKKSKERRADNIVPVSIGQILSSSGEDLKIGKVLVHLVTFVGMVKDIEMTSTKAMYQIDDGTGQIEALLWIDGGIGESLQPSLRSYCRVSGTVRVTQGKRHIIVFNMHPVMDLNEITAHLLEVIDVYQCAPNLSSDPIQNSRVPSTSTNPTNNALSNSMMNMNQVDDGLDQHAPSDPQQRMVFKVISDAAYEDDGGVDVSFIAKKLNGRMGENQVRTLTDFLLQEGFIFSTIDDEHFTVTR